MHFAQFSLLEYQKTHDKTTNGSDPRRDFCILCTLFSSSNLIAERNLGSSRKVGGLGDGNRRRASNLVADGALRALGAYGAVGAVEGR